ncbi:MAG: hypothetical protein LBB75_02005, partial [Oscillospiraceae bacterium]|nr:hypothetical protein [Oscillospiraceae bacterium]
EPPEAEEEQPPEKPGKPIKGPRALAWSVAVLLMLFGLAMTAPALWNAVLGLPALAGLVHEAGGNFESAGRAYDFLYQSDMGAQGLGLSGLGLSSGNFYYERQYAIASRRDGPLAVLQSEDLPPISQVFPARAPRRLRAFAAQCEAISGIIENYYAYLQALGEPAEGQSESGWLLDGLEAVRGEDDQADARGLYYETLALMHTAGYPEEKQANLDRIDALKGDPAGEFWMYEGAQLYFAFGDGDYGAVSALCEARLRRNRQDFTAMQYRVKALYLSEGEGKAFAAADAYAKRPAAKDYMQLARAEVFYRQGKYEEAVALCDAILDKADFAAPAATQAQQEDLRMAALAADVKSVALLLQDKPREAIELLETARGNPYTLLAAYAAAGEWENETAQNMVMMLAYYGYEVPQAVMDLSEGTTTVEKIFTEGWGGFDA